MDIEALKDSIDAETLRDNIETLKEKAILIVNDEVRLSALQEIEKLNTLMAVMDDRERFNSTINHNDILLGLNTEHAVFDDFFIKAHDIIARRKPKTGHRNKHRNKTKLQKQSRKKNR